MSTKDGLLKAAEICEAHADEYGSIKNYLTDQQRYREYAAEQALRTAARAIRALAEQEPDGWVSVPTAKELLGAVARGWCHQKNEKKEFDADLAIAIASEVSAILISPLQAEGETKAAGQDTAAQERILPDSDFHTLKNGSSDQADNPAPAVPHAPIEQPRPTISAARVRDIWLANSGALAAWRGRWMDEAGFEKALREAGVTVEDGK